ncbi:hypothetical protein B0I35DRAFT_507893 [Stachybotrys elegans]|uniref:Carrier domain-containing protein n=1 Tax=Stachybotrys elegans TaxID=80388 RepID=A0A8K0WZ86_9HYPO|nr:hypothetical protein B0I35DRAFT_507893 [Stachybotrys elegans]
MNSIAITGLSFKFPQGAEDEDSFWDLLQAGRNTRTLWPQSRLNIDSFYQKDSSKAGLSSPYGNFLREEPAVFDAPFFSITSQDAASMDPQQRWLLEGAYHALESAGIPVEKASGTDTAVFAASMTDDYLRIISKDTEHVPTNTGTGTNSSILANRISWYFNLRGPSIQLNTACSSSLVALDLACKALQSGQCSMALVAASNLLLSPDLSLHLARMNMGSPDGFCYSFDHRANGYVRGEGIAVLVVKRLSDAIRDGDAIRGVIRATGSNQDGRTPGITQPNRVAQEALIRKLYKESNLGFEETRYVEAHGTGTKLGDSTEVETIDRVFRTSRSVEQPLHMQVIELTDTYIRLTTGLASVIKCILILQKGVIPPNPLFQKWNSKVNARKMDHINVPTSCIPWPSVGLRRVSINSFGFGGTNSHMIMDDAYHTLEALSLNGSHLSLHCVNGNGKLRSLPMEKAEQHADSDGSFHLLIWSARDEPALKRILQQFTKYCRETTDMGSRLEHMANILAMRRSIMSWRSFAVVDASESIAFDKSPSNQVRSARESRLAFVFTGQGAQYANMGVGLLRYPVFHDTMVKFNTYLQELGAGWSLFDVIRDGQKVHSPEYSQPLCTALQISLVELLGAFNILPEAVIGHSSGEIAAAYAAGALSLESACRVAYHRGSLAGRLVATTPTPGAMLSVNMPEVDACSYLAKTQNEVDVQVACANSPANVTLSGKEAAIDALADQLEKDGIFARKLKTGVAYHSPAMQQIAADYLDSIRDLQQGPRRGNVVSPLVISSVTGQMITAKSLSQGEYWVENLVCPVRFTDALQHLLHTSKLGVNGIKAISDFIEVGPHGALRRPVSDTLRHVFGSNGPQYTAALSRMDSPVKSIMELAGKLFIGGYPASISAVNLSKSTDSPRLLPNLPLYPFDHSRSYWHESRMSRDWRLREPAGILGTRAADWNPLQPRWTRMLSLRDMPWLADHSIQGRALFPATGTLLMAIEAAVRSAPSNLEVSGYRIKEAILANPIVIQPEDTTEVVTHLFPLPHKHGMTRRFRVEVFAHLDNFWSQCLEAEVHLVLDETPAGGIDQDVFDLSLRVGCTKKISSQDFYTWLDDHGLNYGNVFSLVEGISWNNDELVAAHINHEGAIGHGHMDGLVHPAVLDACYQLCFVGPSKGMSQSLPTIVPHKIRNAWISATGWPRIAQDGQMQVISRSRARKTRPGVVGSFAAYSHDGVKLCYFEYAEMLPVSSSPENDTSIRKILHRIDWKPQLSLLSSKQLSEYVNRRGLRSESGCFPDYKRLERVLRAFLAQRLRELKEVPTDVSKYVAWIGQQVGRRSVSSALDSGDIKAELNHLAVHHPPWQIFPELAKNIVSLVRGEANPHLNKLAQEFYLDFSKPAISSGPSLAYLQLLAHQNPLQKILEVGIGVGDVSENVLSALQQIETRTGGCSFSEYIYAGESQGACDEAKERFRDGHRMATKTINLEADIETQGFHLAAYDLVIVSSVGIKSLPATIRNLRHLLKPAGRLMVHGIDASGSLCAGLVFGTLPGWRPAESDGSASVKEEWNGLLKDNGFSGNDLVITNPQSNDSVSVIISTASISEPVPESEKSIAIIINDNDYQSSLALALQDGVFAQHSCQIVHLGEVAADTLEHVVFLADMKDPLLSRISVADFKHLKSVVQRCKSLLWVSGSMGDHVPYFGLKDGLLRTLRAEFTTKQLVSLTIEDSLENLSHCAETISIVFSEAFQSKSLESEYVRRGGEILSGRLVEEVDVNWQVASSIAPQKKTEPWAAGPALKLSIGSRGSLDTLHFSEDFRHTQDLGADQVEICAAVCAIDANDVLLANGAIEGPEGFGTICAGTVVRVGSKCTRVKRGDRVCMAANECMYTYPRAVESHVIQIADHISLEDACAMMSPAVTAWHALMTVARIQMGERVLIHAATSLVGQLAVQVARIVGAEVFAVVSNESEKDVLSRYDIPASCIFCSDNSFAAFILSATAGYGVDVVLNPISGEDSTALHASWECIAPYGRFVEVGKANSSLPRGFDKNLTFSATNISFDGTDRRISEALQAVMTLLEGGKIRNAASTKVFEVEAVRDAFKYLHHGNERAIICIDPSAPVEKYITRQRKWSFHGDSTYVVAGGLGGIGRAILEWMVERGARHLIVPSRSGADTPNRIDTVQRLAERGVSIHTPKCDVSSSRSVAQMLQDCSKTMPPVKGCIIATMALNDAVFETMTHMQWEQTIKSKVDSSWNLHCLLPPELDFFVMLSSISGIVGNAGQANYAAGCTFQDALARHRVRQGYRALSIDVGVVDDVGVVAENQALKKKLNDSSSMAKVTKNELLALLDIFCDPSATILSPDQSHITMGVTTPADILAKGVQVPETMQRPPYSYFCHEPGTLTAAVSGKVDSPGTLFRQSKSPEDAATVVVESLAQKLAKALSVEPEVVEHDKPLHSFGVDSLVAVELRNWFAKEFLVDMQVFELTGGRSLGAIAELVAARYQPEQVQSNVAGNGTNQVTMNGS